MSLLFRYLTKNNAMILLPTLAVGIGLYVLTDLFERLDNFIEAGLSVGMVLTYFVVKMPLVISQILPRAKEAVRKGQMFWDFVSAENSVGFHNPAKALDTLTSSITLSQDAINAALKATNYGIAPKLEGDIKQIVPPILKMSRKLQQDPEYLKTHPWFAYLKPLPKADQMWEGNKKIQ